MIKLFISYAAEDEHFARQLEKHIIQLRRQGIVELWHAGKLLPGDHIDDVIARHLDEANLHLLLLSVDFLCSYSRYEVQLRSAMQRHRSNDARVIPVIIRSADYTGTPFEQLQALPRNQRPIGEQDHQDAAWTAVVDGIREVIQRWRYPGKLETPSLAAANADNECSSSLPYLEARFRRTELGWEVQLAPETQQKREWRDFKEPRRPEDVFQALFDEDRDADLVRRPWRLRLRPKELVPEEAMPQPKLWASLFHPTAGCHLLDIGWTVTELTVRPGPAEFSGTIAVVGGPKLAQALRTMLGPCVEESSLANLPPRAVIVVAPGAGTDSSVEVQRCAAGARCPLIIWGDPGVTTRSEIAEVLLLSATTEPFAAWLVRFLSRLRSGVDPEQAFSWVGLGGPPEDRPLRLLRGAFTEWLVDTAPGAGRVDSRWYIRLDRLQQEAEFNRLVHHLVYPSSARRVQVVLCAGPDGAGLSLFSHRPPMISLEVPRIPIDAWDLSWT